MNAEPQLSLPINHQLTNNLQTEAVDLLTKLVSIPSPSEQEAKAANFLTGWMNAHGFSAHIDDAGNAVGVKGEGPHEILLLGHIDTFPGDVPTRREGDILYGRGTVDAKGPLGAFAAATAQIEIPKAWRVTVVGAVEEESATSKGARHILAQRHQHPPVYCLIGEPSSWDRITLGYKGRLLVDVLLRAPFSHSAGEGRLPAEQAVDLWRQIEWQCANLNRERQATGPFTRLDPSLRHITSRDEGAFGVVEMSLGFRLPIGITLLELEQRLRGVAQTLPDESSLELKFFGGEPAFKGNKSSPLVRAFLKVIRAANGNPRFVVKTGTSDMNVVAPHWPDTPILAYGPGDSSLDHTPDEHVDLNEYLQTIEILTAVLNLLTANNQP